MVGGSILDIRQNDNAGLMNHMDTHQLRAFLTTCEELHIGRAAEKLGIAQPALSQQIKGLEARLGVQLFIRAHRRIDLTDAGRIFEKEARKVVSSMDRAINLARASARGMAGELQIGYVGSVVEDPLLSQFLRDFLKTYPKLTLTMHENTPLRLLEDIGTRRLDIALVRGPIEDVPPEFESILLARNQLAIALPHGHRIAETTGLSIDTLAEENFVSYPDPAGVGLHSSLMQLCATKSFEPHIGVTAGSVASALSLVSCGLGIALVPAFSSRQGVVIKPLNDTLAWSDICLVKKSGAAGSLDSRFIELALSYLASK